LHSIQRISRSVHWKWLLDVLYPDDDDVVLHTVRFLRLQGPAHIPSDQVPLAGRRGNLVAEIRTRNLCPGMPDDILEMVV
jgi:hypothetical protein